MLILFSMLFTAETLMYLIAAIVPHYIIGIALGAALFGLNMLCMGMFKVKSDIPPWFIWGYYTGFHTYGFAAFLENEFESIDSFDPSTGFANGPAVLSYYGVDRDTKVRNIGICFAFGFLFWVNYATALYYFHTGKR